MREGSAIGRLKQSMSRGLQRGVNMIRPVGPRVLQWLSNAGRGGLARLRATPWPIFPQGIERKEWISIAALLVSVVSAFYAYRKAELTMQSLKQHLDPELVCSLGNIRDQFALFSLVNEGQIAAESIIVDHVTLRYEKKGEKTGQIRMAGYGGDLPFPSGQLARPGARWDYASKLEPNQHTPPKETGMFVPPAPYNEKLIAILFFKVTYLRPTDGKRYEKCCFFYKEGDDHYQTRTSFGSNPHFDAVNAEIYRFLEKNISGQSHPVPGVLRE
jgi:hypothetical protein